MTTTTLLRSRTPLESLSMNQQSQRRKSKRGSAYDEEDDGFKFTRGSKRTKVQATPSEPPDAPIASQSKKTAARQDEPIAEKKQPGRRKMDFSTPKHDAKPPPRKGTRQSARLSNGDNGGVKESANGNIMEATDYDSIEMVGVSAAGDDSRANMDVSKESIKISLPFSDTPVINRNKEIRKTAGGRRRSSLGMRGRRASSLIDNGHSAMPHSQVETTLFYKHIESEGLSEPRRMKQLLTWCAERALGPKPAHGNSDIVALLSARPVQEHILNAFSARSEMSDWFQRDAPVKSTVIKKPNPLDAQNEAKIKALEERIKRLKKERDHWKALQKDPKPLPPLLDSSGEPPSPSALDASLLDAEDAAILESLKATSSSSLLSSTQQNLQSLQEGLEFKVDQFADGIHKLSQARQAMDKVAEKVMALSAVRLEEREKVEKTATGTRDLPMQEILRSLSRIMPDGGR